ncbi:MAG: hypothetical protein ACOYJ6_05730 [Caulobacterales bacterium]|jgi:hypothetical protein
MREVGINCHKAINLAGGRAQKVAVLLSCEPHLGGCLNVVAVDQSSELAGQAFIKQNAH